MNKKHLDQMFDEALKRTEKDLGISDPYNMGPLASDHFLLKKSWIFFKKRIQEIENNYEDLLKARDIRVNSLEKELKKLRDHEHIDFEQKNDLGRIKTDLYRSQAQEWIKAKEKHERFIRASQEERIVLEEKIRSLEQQLEVKENRITQSRLDFIKKEQAYASELKRLREDKELWVEEKLGLKQQHTQDIADLEARENGQYAKIDLLRAELNERFQLMQKMTNTIKEHEEKIGDLESNLLEAKTTLEEKANIIKNLTEEKRILQKEIDSVRLSWQTEQAQWRELWEQVRGFLDTKREHEQDN